MFTGYQWGFKLVFFKFLEIGRFQSIFGLLGLYDFIFQVVVRLRDDICNFFSIMFDIYLVLVNGSCYYDYRNGYIYMKRKILIV